MATSDEFGELAVPSSDHMKTEIAKHNIKINDLFNKTTDSNYDD